MWTKCAIKLCFGVLFLSFMLTGSALSHKLCPAGKPRCFEQQKVYHRCCRAGHRHIGGGLGMAHCMVDDYGPTCEFGSLRMNRPRIGTPHSK
jgi:hypothetical protein